MTRPRARGLFVPKADSAELRWIPRMSHTPAIRLEPHYQLGKLDSTAAEAPLAPERGSRRLRSSEAFSLPYRRAATRGLSGRMYAVWSPRPSPKVREKPPLLGVAADVGAGLLLVLPSGGRIQGVLLRRAE